MKPPRCQAKFTCQDAEWRTTTRGGHTNNLMKPIRECRFNGRCNRQPRELPWWISKKALPYIEAELKEGT